MHADEYEISLLREVEVCRNRLERLKASLLKMELRYGIATETFVERHRKGKSPVSGRDGSDWIEEYEARALWEKRLKEYEGRVSLMKV